ncbi:unnamed protein product [Ostreobium quekettii]|uniref:Uncharacterized protein n=1 Tax=Ostreobium quekettii TaxID=121088 RepID=A0A8S1IWP1_9CHLO|nr:unnamed protein product [Ostreobium quekettii]
MTAAAPIPGPPYPSRRPAHIPASRPTPRLAPSGLRSSIGPCRRPSQGAGIGPSATAVRAMAGMDPDMVVAGEPRGPLLVIGPGVLGTYLGKLWLEMGHQGGEDAGVVGQSRTEESHERSVRGRGGGGNGLVASRMWFECVIGGVWLIEAVEREEAPGHLWVCEWIALGIQERRVLRVCCTLMGKFVRRKSLARSVRPEAVLICIRLIKSMLGWCSNSAAHEHKTGQTGGAGQHHHLESQISCSLVGHKEHPLWSSVGHCVPWVLVRAVGSSYAECLA